MRYARQLVGRDIQLPTVAMTAEQLQALLLGALHEMKSAIGEEANGFEWRPLMRSTELVDHQAGRLLVSTERQLCINSRADLSLRRTSAFYEDKTFHSAEVMLLLSAHPFYRFWLRGNEEPDTPITQVVFHEGLMGAEPSSALRRLFERLLGRV